MNNVSKEINYLYTDILNSPQNILTVDSTKREEIINKVIIARNKEHRDEQSSQDTIITYNITNNNLTEDNLTGNNSLTIRKNMWTVDNKNEAVLSIAPQISIPINILKNNSSLQAIVFYLKEDLNMSFSNIAKLINRDQRTVWSTYDKSKNKIHIDRINTAANNLNNPDNLTNILIPINIFSARELSVLETIVFYLKSDSQLSLKEISELLGKNYRTIWTVYKRTLCKFKNTKNG